MTMRSTLSSYRPREFHRNVRLFFLYGTGINAGMALFSLLFNLYLLRLGYQEDFIGLLAGMSPLATGLVALPIGWWSDRIGRRPFLIASGILLSASQAGLCLFTDSLLLLLFSFAGGVSTAFIWVNHVPFLSDNAEPSQRAEALVIWSALQVAVRMLLSLVGGFLPAAMAWFLGDATTEMPDPFRYSLLLGAACSLMSVLPLLRISGGVVKEGSDAKVDTSDEGKAPEATTAMRSWRAYGAIASLSGLRGFSMGLTYPFFNVFFEEELQVGPAAIGGIFFLSQLVGLPATFAAPSLVRRFGATLTILPARAIGGGALGLMGAFINLPVAIFTFLLSRACEVVDNPSDQHFSTQILPRRYWARVQGFRVCGFQLFNSAGSVLGGLLILNFGYGAAFELACAARIASGLIMAGWFGLRPASR